MCCVVCLLVQNFVYAQVYPGDPMYPGGAGFKSNESVNLVQDIRCGETEYTDYKGNVVRVSKDSTVVYTRVDTITKGRGNKITTEYVYNGIRYQVKLPFYETKTIRMCGTNPVEHWRGKSFTRDMLPLEKVYSFADTVSLADGCDSIYILHIWTGLSEYSRVDTFMCGKDTFRYGRHSLCYENFGDQIISSEDVVRGDTFFTPIEGVVYSKYIYSYYNDRCCNSFDTIFLTIKSISKAEEWLEVCDSVRWGDTVFYDSWLSSEYFHNGDGVVEKVLDTKNVDGCDSIVSLVYVDVDYTYRYYDTVIACDEYVWHGRRHTSSDDYVNLDVTKFFGCDSNEYLRLTIKNSSHLSFNVTACDSFVWENNDSSLLFNTSGKYVNHYNNAGNQCPSADTLYLNINRNTSSCIYDTACDMLIWSHHRYHDWIDDIYDTVIYQSGMYVYRYFTPDGCYSIDTIFATVYPNVNKRYDTTVCNSMTWVNHGWNNAYTEATNGQYVSYTHDYQMVYNGYFQCLNTDTLRLKLYKDQKVDMRDSACSYEKYYWRRWRGQHLLPLAKAGIYKDTVHNVFEGKYCDSIISLQFVIYNDDTIKMSDVICQDLAPYRWIDGIGYSTSISDTVRHIDRHNGVCDSVYTLKLKVNDTFYVADYAVVCRTDLPYKWNGVWFDDAYMQNTTLKSKDDCDSTIVMQLAVNDNTYDAFTQNICDTGAFRWLNHGLDTNIITAGTYRHSYIDGNNCPSTDTLHVFVRQSSHDTIMRDVCDKYVWHWQRYGNMAFDTAITTNGVYLHSYINDNNCPSVDTLHIRVRYNSSTLYKDTACEKYRWFLRGSFVDEYTIGGRYYSDYLSDEGCPSVDTLQLTIYYNSHNVATDSMCSYESIAWRKWSSCYSGRPIKTAGVYHDTIRGIYAGRYCDSVFKLVVHVYNDDTTRKSAVICQNFAPYRWIDGKNYRVSTKDTIRHIDKYRGVCDSVFAINLVVKDTSYREYERSTCQSKQPYIWNDSAFVVSGNKTTVLKKSNGCDSTVLMKLMVNDTFSLSDTHYVCQGTYPYTWFTGSYNPSQVFNSATTKKVTLHTLYSCDSVVDMTLRNFPVYDTTLYDTVCDDALPYVWKGISFMSSKTESVTLSSIHDCDSIVRMSLFVKQRKHTTVDTARCYKYVWGDRLFNYSQTAKDTFLAVNGCDSIVTQHIVIHDTTYSVYTVSHACDTFVWYDSAYTVSTNSARRIHTGANSHKCDSVETLNLSLFYNTNSKDVQRSCDTFIWRHRGVEVRGYGVSNVDTHAYVNDAGCLSVDTLQISVFYSSVGKDSSITRCDSIVWVDGDAGGRNRTLLLRSSVWQSPVVDCKTDNIDSSFHYTNAVGCDSIQHVHFVIRSRTVGDTVVDSCYHYTWHEVGYDSDANAVYNYRGINKAGCDSMVTLHLYIHDTTYSVYTVPYACDTFVWYDSAHVVSTNTARHLHAGANVHGCDSVETLSLSLYYNSSSKTIQRVCDTFTWFHRDVKVRGYNVSATDTHAYINDVGCLSVDTLQLDVVYSSVGKDSSITQCDSVVWMDGESGGGSRRLILRNSVWGSPVRYIVKTNIDSSFHYTNAVGCDSVQNVHFVINSRTVGDTNVDSCYRFAWHGMVYDRDAMPEHNYHNINSAGCDSVVVLNLRIHYASIGDTFATACDSFRWDGLWYNCSNEIIHPRHGQINQWGCDSSARLNLTIYPHTVFETARSVCDSFLWEDEMYGFFSHRYYRSVDAVDTMHNTDLHGCDSVVVLHLTVRYSTSHDTSMSGCDSIVWLDPERRLSFTSSAHSAISPLARIEYYDTLWHYQNNVRCDSLERLHFVVYNSTMGDTIARSCDSFIWYEHRLLTSNNTVTHKLGKSNVLGCDSIVHLNLSVSYTQHTDTFATSCDSFWWYNRRLSQSLDTCTHTLYKASVDNCDSVLHLKLQMFFHDTGTLSMTVCDSLLWKTSSSNIYKDTTYTITGVYSYDSLTVHKCDSVTMLNLRVNYSNFGPDSLLIGCDSLQRRDTVAPFINTTYFSSVYPLYDVIVHYDSVSSVLHYANQYGCDSAVSLLLVIKSSTTKDTAIESCNVLNWHNTNYYESQTTLANITHSDGTRNYVGCDTLNRLFVTIYKNSIVNVSDTSCDFYEWHDRIYSSSVLPPNNPAYFKAGQDIHGCDSVEYLYITINKSSKGDTIASVCDSMKWYGNTYYTSSKVIHHLVNRHGCDSTLTLNLAVRHSSADTVDRIACDTFCWQPTCYTYRKSGFYSAPVIKNKVGCDSSQYLNLKINLSTTGPDTGVMACDSFMWYGINYSCDTKVKHTFANANSVNCDSTISLVLVNKDSPVTHLNRSACNVYSWYGQKITESTVVSKSYPKKPGQYCDSVVFVHLTINRNTSSSHSADGCDSVVVANLNVLNGVYRQSQRASVVVPNAHGCDSAITLNVKVNHSSRQSVSHKACDAFYWPYSRKNYFNSAVDSARVYGVNSEGCDSVLLMHLTMSYSSTVDCFDTICSCWGYRWQRNDKYYDHSVVDTVRLKNTAGCDSNTILYLTVYPCFDTVYGNDTIACDTLIWNVDNRKYTRTQWAEYRYTDQHGCNHSERQHLVVNYSIRTHRYDSICNGQHVLLGNEYLDTSGHYEQRFPWVAKNGCDSISILDLYVWPDIVPVIEVSHNCVDRSFTLRNLTPAPVHHWKAFPDDPNLEYQADDSVITISPTATTVYTLTANVSNNSPCAVDTGIVVYPIHVPEAKFTTSTEYFNDDLREVTANGLISKWGKYYAWFVDDEYYSDRQSINYVIDDNADSLRLMFVVYTDDSICTDTAYKTLPVEHNKLFVPNIFTPTEEANNTFCVFTENIIEYEMVIYNRRGQMCFHSKDPHECWDGTHQGSLCPQGAYVYTIKYHTGDEPKAVKRKTGSVMLMR